MKVLASALSLLLVGLTGVWLWFDATAEAGQDRPGVVITGAVDPATTRELAEAAGLDGPPGVPATGEAGAASEGSGTGLDPARADGIVDVLTGASAELRSRWQDTVDAAEEEAKKAEEEADDAARAAEEAAEDAARAAEEAAEDAARAQEEAAEEAARAQEEAAEEAADRAPAPQPVPVQPPPVAPDRDEDDWDDDDDDDWDDVDDDDDDDDDRDDD